MATTRQTVSTLESNILRRFFLGFPGTDLPVDLRRLLRRGLGGVVIYRRNWTDLAALRALTAEIRRAARRPVLIGIDQEGGTPFSLPAPFTQWPSPSKLGRLVDVEPVERMAEAMAVELRAAGVNLDFAPMLDLHVNPESPVTKVRSYGGDPKRVGQFGGAFIRGMRRQRILTCAKHFPGHGDAAVDPHEDLPVFQGSGVRLRTRELVPFQSAVLARVPLIMTAHILLPQIDPERPATLSRIALHGILRKALRFRGVILADDLGMGAISRRHSPGEAAIASLRAGSDMVMLCHDWTAVQPAVAAVMDARERGAFDDREWRSSGLRIAGALRQAARSGPVARATAIGSHAHRVMARALRALLEAL